MVLNLRARAICPPRPFPSSNLTARGSIKALPRRFSPSRIRPATVRPPSGPFTVRARRAPWSCRVRAARANRTCSPCCTTPLPPPRRLRIGRMTGRGAPASPPSKTCTYLAAWLTGRVLAELRLNDRQRLAITHLKIHGRITNSDFQKLTGAPHRTAARDLMGLVRLGLLDHKGTGRGAGYVLHLNRAINVPNAPSPPCAHPKTKRAINVPNVPPTQTRREPGNPVTVKGSAKGPQRAQSALTKSAINRPNLPSAEKGQKQDKRNTPPKSAGSRRLPKGPKRK